MCVFLGCIVFYDKLNSTTDVSINLPSHADRIKTCASFNEHLHELRALGLDGQVERGHPTLLVGHVHIDPEKSSLHFKPCLCLH